MHLVQVLKLLPRYAYPRVTPEIYSLVDNERTERARELLARETDGLRDVGANVAEVHLREGPTVDEILDSGDEVSAGFIVIGTRGLGPVENLLLGSISEGVVHHSRRPILMVLAEGGEPGRLSSTGHRGNDSVS
jgi:nucleotide-binding universal stress UspA family protein